MREFILKRIEDLKIKERGFPKDTMRWRNSEFDGKHFSVLKFEDLCNEDLIQVFELLLFKYYKNMG